METHPLYSYCINEYKHSWVGLRRLTLNSDVAITLELFFLSLVFFIFPLHLYRAKARDEKCFIRNYVNFSLHVHRQAAQRKFEKFPQSVSSTALTPKWKEHSKRAQMKMLAHNSPIFHVVFFLRGRFMYNIFSNRKIMLLDY